MIHEALRCIAGTQPALVFALVPAGLIHISAHVCRTCCFDKHAHSYTVPGNTRTRLAYTGQQTWDKCLERQQARTFSRTQLGGIASVRVV